MWTPAGPPERFLLEMNLSNLDTSLFWTVDTFFLVPSMVENLFKVDSRLVSWYFRYSLKSQRRKLRVKEF